MQSLKIHDLKSNCFWDPEFLLLNVDDYSSFANDSRIQ